MNISSTSRPEKLSAASTTMLQGERGPSPVQVGSVKAEIKPVGAERGEAVPLAADINRRKIAAVKTLPAKSRKSRAASQQESKPKKLYGTYSISRFTKDDLEKVTKEIMRVEANQAGPGSKQKLAALKVQEFILGKLTGQYDAATLLKIEEDVNLLSDELYPEQKNKQDVEAGQVIQVIGPRIITSPVDLWSVNFDQEHPCLAVNFVDNKRKMFKHLKDEKENMKKKLKCEEESKVMVEKAVKRAIKIVEEYICKIDFYLKSEYYFSMVLPCVEYIYHERWFVEAINQLSPDWCDKIAMYGIEILPDDEQRPTPFEERILACHQLYREYMKDDTQPLGYFKRIDLLERYQGQIKFDMEHKEITRIEAQQLIFLWCYNLFRLASSRYLIHICISDNQELAAQGSAYRKKCLNMARSAINNGFLDVIDPAGAQQQSSDNVAGQSKNPEEYDEVELQDLIVKFGMHVARNDQLQQTCINAIYASEMLGSEKGFNHVMAALSRYSPLPLLVRIWHDLGMPETHYHWSPSGLPRLECAIDFLIKSRRQREELLTIEPVVEDEARQIKACGEKRLPYQIKWVPRIALYYFCIDKEEEGRDILRYGGVDCHTLPTLLLHIANKQFKAAIELIENVLKKDEQDMADRADSMVLQHPGMQITSLSGSLHKRLAEDPGCKDDEKRQYLAQASDYLSERVGTCTELYLPMADIQNKRGDYHGACESYRNLEQLLAGFPDTSYENCQLYFIRQARVILEEFGQDISEDAFSEHEGFLKDTKDKKSKEATREKPVSMIPPIRSPIELSSGAEEAMLPSVPVGMEPLSEVAVQDQALAVCIECLTVKGEDMQWKSDRNLEPVAEKMHVSGTGTIDSLTEEVVQKQLRASSAERYQLYNELLSSGDIDYKKLLAKCDNLYESTDSIFLRLIIRQDKMRILRHKTFDAYALECESRQAGVPVMKIKIDSWKEILDGLYSNIEGVLTPLMSEELSQEARGWKKFPRLIFRSERFVRCLQDQAIAGHFWTQLGAQFSAISNVARDVSLDQPPTREMRQYLRTTLGAYPTAFRRRSSYFRSIAENIQNKQPPPQQPQQ